MGIKKYGTMLLREGYRKRASDLYIFPKGKGYELAFRYHQLKQVIGYLSQIEGEKLLLYYKYLADMDVSEKRRAQVGAGSLKIRGQKQRLRFSTVGDFLNRESLVIRFLHDFTDESNYHCFFPNDLALLERQIQRTGLYLFSGPTGSGKTTTMYRLAKLLAQDKQQVITIEDPVEIEDQQFLQLQVNKKIQLSYEKLVKVCLRHRPDILIVGEIRDGETAKAVIRGALTGHTIFSTIHGLNKESVIPRLLELGVAKEELRQCLQGIIYQKLLPVKCPYCQTTCPAYCQHRESGVLFDTLFFEKKGNKQVGQASDWQKKLGKAWCYGFISDAIYEKEQ